MGIRISREPKTEQYLARQIRKQNCKVNRKFFKMLEAAYIDGILTQLEYQVTRSIEKG